MCRRCATSARDNPCRSRDSARTWPGGAGAGLSWTISTALLPRLQLLKLGRVGEAPAQLLHVAVLRDLVAVLAREPHAQHQRLDRGLREPHVAQQVAFGILVRAAVVGEQ